MNKKHLLLFVVTLLAMTTITSCEKDKAAPLPEISGVEISDNFNPSTDVLTKGESLTFTLKVENAANCKWYVDEKLQEGKDTFVFTPTMRGSYHIKVVAANEDNVTSEYEVGTINVVDPAPVVAEIMCNDLKITDKVALNVGTAANFTVNCTNVDVESFVWSVDGTVVEGAIGNTYKLESDWSGEHTIEIQLKNVDEISTKVSFVVAFDGEYKDLLMLVTESDAGMSYGEVNVVKEGALLENRYEFVNKSNLNASINDATLYGNNLYFLSTTSDFIYEVDRQTLKLKRKISKGAAQLSGLGTVRRMVVASKEKAYVSLWGTGTKGAVAAIDLIKGEGAKAIAVPGMFTDKMIVVGKSVIFGAKNQLQSINSDNDQLTTLATFDEGREVRGVTLGRNGKLYVAVTAVSDGKSKPVAGSKSQIVCLNSSTFAIESTTELNVQFGLNTNSMYPCSSLCSSSSNDMLYFVITGSEWGATSTIYSFNTLSKTSEIFASPEKGIYGYMTISQDGTTLNFPWGDGYMSNGFYSYSTATKAKVDYEIGSVPPCIAIQ